ncbi:MAG: hypothetical protein AAB309_05735 [Deltaproteobacteria bacterium]
MIKQIISLIFLGIFIAVGISEGFNIRKMAVKMRAMTIEAMHTARKQPLPTLKGKPPVNPYGCGDYECYKRMKGMQ